MDKKKYYSNCNCPHVCQLIAFMSEKPQVYLKDMEELGVGRTKSYQMFKNATKLGLIDSYFLGSKTKGAARKYYFLTEKGKRQATLIKACNEHLLSK